ncbi:MAG TPA: hypothetical protein VNF27_04730 [Candidatus Binataceae bacterium]|nr:hypothetical protein [Candidatus Binataceae bacterium]
MTIAQRLKSERGATQVGFTDALVTAILLGILLFVAYLQFATYNHAPSAVPQASPIAAPH